MFPLPPPPPVALVPVPVRVTEAAGLDWPLIVMLKVPDAAPAAVGLNVTDAVPVPPLAARVRLDGNTVNGPLALRLTVADAPPLFVTVMVLAELVWPTFTLPKSSDVGVTVMFAVGFGGDVVPVPVPASEMATTARAGSGSLLAMLSVPDWTPAAVGVKRTRNCKAASPTV